MTMHEEIVKIMETKIPNSYKLIYYMEPYDDSLSDERGEGDLIRRHVASVTVTTTGYYEHRRSSFIDPDQRCINLMAYYEELTHNRLNESRYRVVLYDYTNNVTISYHSSAEATDKVYERILNYLFTLNWNE